MFRHRDDGSRGKNANPVHRTADLVVIKPETGRHARRY